MANRKVTRRLAAILALDMVGYSRLMEADEAATIARHKAHRAGLIDPMVAEHRGRIVASAGDGMLVEFGSAVDAVECAVSIQHAMTEREADVPDDRRIRYRIGVNLGDIVVDGDDVLGDGVNVAARLEAVAEPGGIAVSGATHEQIAGKVACNFRALGVRQFKNIARPIAVWDWVPTPPPSAEAITGRPVTTDRPAIAVLPIENLSSDRELDFLADGLTEDIVTLLARLPGFLVIARHSTMGYKGGARDVQRVGRELGVRYIVMGSIRPIGAKLRIAIQLIDARAGSHLWGDRFDRPTTEIAALQDEMTSGIVAHLQPELTRAEVDLAKRYTPKDLDAWTLYQRGGMALIDHGWTEDGFGGAAELYREAIARDADFAPAHAALSLTLAIGHLVGIVDNAAEAAAEAERALALANDSSEVLGLAGCAISDLGDRDRGIAILERAVELNPSNAQAWTALGTAFLAKGEFDKAVENLSYGIRISPRDPRLAVWGGLLALAMAMQGRLDEAIAEARAACRCDTRLHAPWVILAVLSAQAGRADDAKAALAEALRLRPGLSKREVRALAGRDGIQALSSIWQPL